MHLKLFVKDKLVATHPINAAYVSYPVYLTSIKSELQKKYSDVIETAKATPVFYLETNKNKNATRNNRPLL